MPRHSKADMGVGKPDTGHVVKAFTPNGTLIRTVGEVSNRGGSVSSVSVLHIQAVALWLWLWLWLWPAVSFEHACACACERMDVSIWLCKVHRTTTRVLRLCAPLWLLVIRRLARLALVWHLCSLATLLISRLLQINRRFSLLMAMVA